MAMISLLSDVSPQEDHANTARGGGAAVFFDKDGTLVHDVPYNVAPDRTVLVDDALASMKRLHEHGFRLFIVTNQAGVALSRFEEKDLHLLHEHLRVLMANEGIPLAGFYYCPHHPDGIEPYSLACKCRKPQPGLILEAAAANNIDLAQSWMVGDILNDVEAGKRAGCRTVLLDLGNETEWAQGRYRTPDHTCSSLTHAVDTILRNHNPASLMTACPT